MKKLSKKPGFEFAFYMGLLLLIVLPAMVFAQQDHRAFTIIVKNGDTIVNGKKASQLNAREKRDMQNALADTGIKRPAFARIPRLMDGRIRYGVADSIKDHLNYFYRDTAGHKNEMRVYTDEMRLHNTPHDRMPTVRPNMDRYRMPIWDGSVYRRPGDRDGERPGRRPQLGEQQDFDFNTVDKNGISTNMSFHISAVSPDEAKRVSGTTKADLTILDLTFTPEFSAGKTVLMFSMLNGTPAEVSFTDTDGKPLWTQKSSGTQFAKNFTLPLNGVYYLIVKQGGKTAVKRVVKE